MINTPAPPQSSSQPFPTWIAWVRACRSSSSPSAAELPLLGPQCFLLARWYWNPGPMPSPNGGGDFPMGKSSLSRTKLTKLNEFSWAKLLSTVGINIWGHRISTNLFWKIMVTQDRRHMVLRKSTEGWAVGLVLLHNIYIYIIHIYKHSIYIYTYICYTIFVESC